MWGITEPVVGPFASKPEANAWLLANPSAAVIGITATIAGVPSTYTPGVGWVEQFPRQIARIGIVGDSIDVYGGGIGTLLSAVSGGSLVMVKSIATAGDTSTDQRGKLAGLAGNALDCVVVKLGTNDAYKSGIANKVPLATYIENMEFIGNYILSIGAIPCFVSIPPRSDAGVSYNSVYQKSLESICKSNGWLLSRRWRQINNGTGQYTAGASYDTLHPYTNILYSEAQGLLADIKAAGIVPKIEPNRVEMNSGDYGAKSSNALFLTDTNADGLADGVTKLGSGTASLVANAFGNKQSLSVTSSAGNNGLTVTFSGLTVGKSYMVRGNISVSVSSGRMRMQTFNSASSRNLFPVLSLNGDFTVANADGTMSLTYCEEFVAGSTSAALNVYDPGSGASFVIGLQEWQCWDLSALDLA